MISRGKQGFLIRVRYVAFSACWENLQFNLKMINFSPNGKHKISLNFINHLFTPINRRQNIELSLFFAAKDEMERKRERKIGVHTYSAN
jgi:hypothetical protein